MPETDIGAAVAAAARSINQHTTLEETLATIAAVARTSVPGFDQVGISTIDRKGNVTTRAATGELVWVLDRLQYALGEGPCVDTLRGAQVVVAPRIRHDQRWPEYVPQAVAAGLKAQLAVKLYLDDEGTLGGLNLYSTAADDIDGEAEHLAELFAALAAIALGGVRERHHLNEAPESRQMIGTALGLLMERYEIEDRRSPGDRLTGHRRELRRAAARPRSTGPRARSGRHRPPQRLRRPARRGHPRRDRGTPRRRPDRAYPPTTRSTRARSSVSPVASRASSP
jgi:GAF domain-containing protein